MDSFIEISETLFRLVIGTLVIAAFGIIVGLIYKGIDRTTNTTTFQRCLQIISQRKCDT